MNSRISENPWSIWAKRFVLAAIVALLAYVGGSGLLLAFDLQWRWELFEVAVFGLGAAVHVAVVVLLSEGKRTRQGWTVGLAVAAMVLAAVMDGRFACEHVLRGEGATVEAGASVEALQEDASRLQVELQGQERSLDQLRAETERMDNDGDGSNDGQVRANRKLIPQLEAQLSDRRGEMEKAREKVREARVGAAGTAHRRSTTLQLSDGLSDKQRILVFWGAGSLIMLILGAVVASATWTLGLMSSADCRRPAPEPQPPIPDGGGKLRCENDQVAPRKLNGNAAKSEVLGVKWRAGQWEWNRQHNRRRTKTVRLGADRAEAEAKAATLNAAFEMRTGNVVPFAKGRAA